MALADLMKYSSGRLSTPEEAQRTGMTGTSTNWLSSAPVNRLTPANPGPTLYAGGSPQGYQTMQAQPQRATTQQLPTYTGNNQSASGMTTGGGTQVTQPTQPTQATRGLIATQQTAQPQVSATNTVSGVNQGNNPIAQAQYQTVDPILREVQGNELSRNQLNEMLAEDSPLLQRARARASAAMQSRGLLNSSMAVGAAEGAAWDAATPFALQDAQTYTQAARDNQLAGNAGQEFNAGAFNRNQETNTGYINRRGDINVQEEGQDRRLAVTEKGAMDRLNIQEAGQTSRQNSVNETNIKTTGMNNATTLQATKMNNDTAITTTGMNNATSRDVANIGASASMRNADVAASTALQSAQISASTQRDIAEYNGSIAVQRDQDRMAWEAGQNTLDRVTRIIENPNMTPEYRDEAAARIIEGGRRATSFSNAAGNLPLAVA